MKYLIIHFLFTVLYTINLTYSQTTEEKELKFLSNKFTTENLNQNSFRGDQIYNIISKTGFCIYENGINNRLTQQECGFSGHLSWRFYKAIDNQYYIMNRDGLFIDNYQDNIVNNNPVIGYIRKNSSNQLWKLEYVNNGLFVRLRLSNTQYCLDNGNSSKAGTNYVIWECNINNTNQWFNFQVILPKPDRFYNIVTGEGLCLSINRFQKLTQISCGHSADLIWRFIKTENGYIIENQKNLVIDNSQSKLVNGNSVVGFIRNSNQNQIWNIESNNNGFYFNIRLYNTPFCLDNVDFTRTGTYLLIWLCDSTKKSQSFDFRKILK